MWNNDRFAGFRRQRGKKSKKHPNDEEGVMSLQQVGASNPRSWSFASIGGWVGGIIVVLVLAIMFSASPFFTVEQGEAGVVLRFGKVVSVASPGLNFKVPVMDRVIRMSTRTEKRVYDKVLSYSRDVQEAAIRLSVNYHVPFDKIDEVYSRYGVNYAERVIDPIVPDRTKKVFGQYQAQTVVSERVRLGQQIEDAIKTSVPDAIIIESVQFENIDFSANYTKAIEAAAQAEAEVRKTRYELERERVEAEKRVVQAQAQAAQIRERAQADSEAIRLRGEAEGRAIAAKAKAFIDNPAYANLIAVERWNGVLPHTMLPGSALPFIPVPHGDAVPAPPRPAAATAAR
ncbi:MAG TPA: prohibitin family protein [Xanthobacteraceae bacterium]|nr:prohibitin family protein [Xanthobacteraceae bacterium]